ncbi:hypothetical protein N7539_005710 [Penicillium diatomitis]|uniref:Heme oxygenase-like protein n=1 Tax=Penicillium diatomitis TaxID=2819901 RepID=A0A9W9X4Y0_9EURO|nr:uncharacterized protein N7539_005710 [Penicillium diatomitis]KAJ5483914.1 hypothetical protein N7539_005710 [Penicillium diatomitis]
MTTGDLLTRLRSAIKEPHTSIHKLNLSRIPLCLPPYTTDPSLYAYGLGQYAELFHAIESAWIDLIGDPMDWMYQEYSTKVQKSELNNTATTTTTTTTTTIHPINDETNKSTEGENVDAKEEFPCIHHEDNTIEPPLRSPSNLQDSSSSSSSSSRHPVLDTHDHTRIQNVLRALYMPELMRTKALKDDLRFLNALNATTTQPSRPGVPTTTTTTTSNPDPPHDTHTRTHHLTHSIHQRIQAHPHLLIAYIWILYSALLYGGRDIRTLLLKAGPDFWALSAVELPLPSLRIPPANKLPCPLSFWQIGGPEADAAEIKGRFRARMVDAERALTAPEQEAILQEAVGIFGVMEDMTRFLDEDVRSRG